MWKFLPQNWQMMHILVHSTYSGNWRFYLEYLSNEFEAIVRAFMSSLSTLIF